MAASAKRKVAEGGPSARSPKLRKTQRTTRSTSNKVPRIAKRVGENPLVATVRMLRKEFGLSRPTFARMLGVTAATLAQWEKGVVEPCDSDLAKIRRVARILRSLTRVMRPSFIPTWLTNPNES